MRPDRRGGALRAAEDSLTAQISGGTPPTHCVPPRLESRVGDLADTMLRVRALSLA
ncbi:hypothetical protein ACIHCQ_33190 [Streptomyces sp. NPDC052236]|uniref:hypothetical protein n=1 Tax=Streptomyces sp. NPDC052236 TaxID=3365686 RepID=UPI0037D56504